MSDPRPAPAIHETLIRAEGLSKSYRLGESDVPVLRGLNLEVGRGEFVAVMGQSGSGKSTLLHILGCLDRPSSGRYRFGGRAVDGLNDTVRSRVRASEIGFVFQKYHLLPQLSVFENVGLPFLYSLKPQGNIRNRVMEVLSQVGLTHRALHRPSQLSGGEVQRAAIARALVAKPTLILADEPTGSLDATTGGEILELLERIHQGGATLVMVTHDSKVASRAGRTLHLKDGRFDS